MSTRLETEKVPSYRSLYKSNASERNQIREPKNQIKENGRENDTFFPFPNSLQDYKFFRIGNFAIILLFYKQKEFGSFFPFVRSTSVQVLLFGLKYIIFFERISTATFFDWMEWNGWNQTIPNQQQPALKLSPFCICFSSCSQWWCCCCFWFWLCLWNNIFYPIPRPIKGYDRINHKAFC